MSPDRAAIEKSRSRPIPVIRRRADLIAACCELQQLADDPGCSDTLLVALHLAMDTMSVAEFGLEVVEEERG